MDFERRASRYPGYPFNAAIRHQGGGFQSPSDTQQGALPLSAPPPIKVHQVVKEFLVSLDLLTVPFFAAWVN